MRGERWGALHAVPFTANDAHETRLPVGVHLVARRRNEALLLTLQGALEAPGDMRRPVI